MDRISLLSDDLLLKILSMVQTKDTVTTSLLSKRWCSLWKHVPKVTYMDLNYPNTEFWRPSRFVDKFLLLNKAPVLEGMTLTLGRTCRPTDIQTWISFAISRGVRNLYIYRYRPGSGLIRLPRSLYTCETLVKLFLEGDFIMDYAPLTNSFRSLKVSTLFLVNFSSNEIVDRFFSGCLVLEDLIVVRGNNDNVKIFTISVPSLQRLTVIDGSSQVPGDDVGFVIKAPSLKSLTIANKFSCCYSLVSMPYLVKAYIKLQHGDSKNFKGLLNSAKHVSLCLQPPMDSCPIGIFNQLVSLNLCTCSLDWCRLILRHAPKLRVLRFELKEVRLFPKQNPPLQRCCISSVDVQAQLEQLSSVPQCLISSLETVEWIGYKGTQAEKKVVMYLLENSPQLKTMAIRSLKSTKDSEKLKMLQELSSTQRSSTKCRLSFT
ncbi:putative FBD-associated F-box protein At5g56440 [Arabidopsis lyrata subsp. lyrata]|uniref:putative FBD-associated F-box protein At5g56440 n=1 Tax=Arabidopsis lyrata subsp. lyrata TaxID=81972 RepID=UPI000A29A2A4|nr:putative FBD-associated F-box protein At5g56440 [Arabidopsis lyrata subsp. lyrata]|eukprot:XP_020871687.1 putative FBD-associated F-box protein At5g56440 [Arabidopsis lyrata subsp. lyrata]